MNIDYNLSEVKEFLEKHNADNIDIGYSSMGNYTKAFIEVEFKRDPPDFELFKNADNIVIDESWGDNLVMIELTLNT